MPRSEVLSLVAGVEWLAESHNQSPSRKASRVSASEGFLLDLEVGVQLDRSRADALVSGGLRRAPNFVSCGPESF